MSACLLFSRPVIFLVGSLDRRWRCGSRNDVISQCPFSEGNSNVPHSNTRHTFSPLITLRAQSARAQPGARAAGNNAPQLGSKRPVQTGAFPFEVKRWSDQLVDVLERAPQLLTFDLHVHRCVPPTMFAQLEKAARNGAPAKLPELTLTVWLARRHERVLSEQTLITLGQLLPSLRKLSLADSRPMQQFAAWLSMHEENETMPKPWTSAFGYRIGVQWMVGKLIRRTRKAMTGHTTIELFWPSSLSLRVCHEKCACPFVIIEAATTELSLVCWTRHRLQHAVPASFSCFHRYSPHAVHLPRRPDTQHLWSRRTVLCLLLGPVVVCGSGCADSIAGRFRQQKR